jgi:hypothetical protein
MWSNTMSTDEIKMPPGTSGWSEKDREDYRAGVRVWDNYQGRGLIEFRDMRCLELLAKATQQMRHQHTRMIRNRQCWKAGRVCGNILRHEALLATLKASPHLQISLDDFRKGPIDDTNTAGNL